LTPSLQLQPCFQRVLATEPRSGLRLEERTERRSGSALPCDGVFQPFGGLEARPLTLPVAAWSALLESARSSQPGPLPPHIRQEMRLSRPRVPSINRCPLGACLRRTRRSPPPYSRRCRLRAGFRRSASPSLEPSSGPRSRSSPSSIRQKAALPAARGFRPERSADWITPPVNFCNRYGS
jgi:hypothetical protein